MFAGVATSKNGVQVRIFFSWQSDLPNRTNRGFIQDSLEKAIDLVRGSYEMEVDPVVDRDTQGLPGTPEIARSILAKIHASDAFVGDISTIGTARTRPTPNPNVLTELGYAVGVLCWERIILVCNTAFGEIEQLPFDLRHMRVASYCDADTDHERGNAKRVFAGDLKRRIGEIRDAEQKGQLKPTMRALEVERVRDQTLARVVTPTRTLRYMNDVMGWGQSPEELSKNIAEANGLATRLKELPLPVASLLTAIIRRAKFQRNKWGVALYGVARYDDVLFATGLGQDRFRSLVSLLEEGSFVVVDEHDEDGNLRIGLKQLSSGWLFFADVREFCTRTETPLEDIVEKLRFDLLDEERD